MQWCKSKHSRERYTLNDIKLGHTPTTQQIYDLDLQPLKKEKAAPVMNASSV